MTTKSLRFLAVALIALGTCVSAYAQGGTASQNNFPGGGGGGTTVVNASTLIKSGLLMDWQFSAGAGTTVADASGNGNNGTFCGSAPSWLTIPPGVRLASRGTSCISLPSNVYSALNLAGGSTIQMLFYFDSNDGTQANTQAQYMCLLCTNGNGATAHALGVSLIQTTGNDTANDLAYIVNGIYTTGGPSSSTAWGDTQALWNGIGVLTYVINPSGADLIYINGKLMGTGSLNASIGSAQPLATGGTAFIGYPASGFAFVDAGVCTAAPCMAAMNLYRVVVYNRQLSQQEIASNTAAINYFAGATNIVPTMPCCMGSLNGTPIGVTLNSATTNDQIVLATDSVFGGNTNPGTLWLGRIPLTGTWNFVNAAENGNTASNFQQSAPYSIDPLLRPFAGKNVMFVAYGNDLNTVAASVLFQTAQMTGVRALAAGWTPMFSTLPTRTTAGFDAKRDAYNTLLRQSCPNIVWCPILIDTAADLGVGPDGGGSNATYFSDGVHLIALTSLFNNLSMIVNRQVDRYYGNKTWSTANTYTASGLNTTATTAVTESGNTVTVTFGGGVQMCQAGQPVIIASVTPAGYNTPANQGYMVLSASTSTVTYTNPTSGLGNASVQGTLKCPQQVPADDHLILGGASAAQNFYLDDCVGQTQPTYIKVTDTNAWTINPFFTTETINGGATLTSPVGAATNQPVIELDPIFSGSTTAGCTWSAHLQ
ncbi:MAG TPA: hypothetical protein VIW68_12730 [Candidatus Sulfotelmatobacter sp.]